MTEKEGRRLLLRPLGLRRDRKGANEELDLAEARWHIRLRLAGLRRDWEGTEAQRHKGGKVH